MMLTAEQLKRARQYTAEEVPVPELLEAMKTYCDAIEAWLQSPAPKVIIPNPQEARIQDFQKPLAAWIEVWDILAAAEERAALRLQKELKPTNGAAA